MIELEHYNIFDYYILNKDTAENIQFDRLETITWVDPDNIEHFQMIILERNNKYCFIKPNKQISTGFIFDSSEKLYDYGGDCNYVKIGVGQEYSIWDIYNFDYAFKGFYSEVEDFNYNDVTSFLVRNTSNLNQTDNFKDPFIDYHLYYTCENLFGPFYSKKQAEHFWNEALDKKLVVVFDTETNGLPKNYSNINDWPELVQIAWRVYDWYGHLVKSNNYVIYPENFIISSESSKIHGINTEFATRNGFPLEKVLNEFINDIDVASTIVGHNLEFDLKTIQASIRRVYPRFFQTYIDIIEQKRHLCTMKLGTHYCKIPSPKGYKWPTLSELHLALFSSDFDGSHNAETDARITAKCFWGLYENRLVEKLARLV
jgi:DNA polymerase-3 subunit epsilon